MSGAIISCAKGKGNAVGGGGICAGDISFLPSVLESQQDDFIQQPAGIRKWWAVTEGERKNVRICCKICYNQCHFYSAE